MAATGHVAVLAALLAILAAHPAATAALALAGGATILRWGTGSLGAIVGAQAVLGPAGVVGPGMAAAGSWLAAAAVLLSTPGPVTIRPLGAAMLGAVATGTTAATLVMGPSPVDRPAVRIAGLLGGILAAILVTFVPWRRIVALLAVAAGVAAAVLTIAA